ncbi:LAETG motif-containing sortase-dependent surface protein [Streptomyces sp. bgisy153]|uniref:LAETG motif-containing sortase-dependent surface protein n=1 Tax=Streptomyces sp. bgisy153 TaxID=3413793 RepID=UPI003D742387
MKLRRAMVTVAATAVIAPLALLSAPSAYADDTPSSGASASQDGSAKTSQTEDDTTRSTSDPARSSETEDTENGQNTVSGAAPETGDPETGDSKAGGSGSGGSGSGESGSGGSGSKNGEASGSGEQENSGAEKDENQNPGTSEGEDDGEDSEPPFCEDIDEDYEGAALDSEITGLPGKIVAGSGWHDFSLKVTNTSKADLKEVAVYAEVENFRSDEYTDYLSPYVELQFLNPETKKWEEIRESFQDENGNDRSWAGGYFWGLDVMKPQDYIKADLRLSIHKDAPVGDGYFFDAGAYLDTVDDQECVATNYGSDAYFTVLAPGTSNEDPGEAEPGDGSTTKPIPQTKPETKPQGGVSRLPVTGSLAETGSSSALPLIGTVGGVAVLAGAGVMFAVRRRKAGTTA